MKNRLRTSVVSLFAVLLAGCAANGPLYSPAVPQKTEPLANGEVAYDYDLDYDGACDYRERMSAAGRVVAVRFNPDEDEVPYPPDIAETAHLIIILDSVPFELVEEMWKQGRFRYFYPPGRVISTFPVMTDPAIAEFFGIAPIPGVEASFYDGRQLTNGLASYLSKRNMPWTQLVDYYLLPFGHMFVYTNPDPWFDHELGNIEQKGLPFLQRGEPFVGYVVSTSALGSWFGRNGHERALIRLDRFCRSLIHRTHGKIHITLMSDHGHNLVPSKRLALANELEHAGYRLATHGGPGVDAIVPEWGIVTCAAIYTKAPASVARDVIGFAGVELTAYCDEQDRIVLLSRGGRAMIERSGDRYRYTTEFGDPLSLLPVLERLKADGTVDADGFVDDRALFDATQATDLPDTVHRLWRGFHGLFEHTPDVLVAIKDGYHVGSDDLNKRLTMQATHGNLHRLSSTAFVMTTAGPVPEVERMEDLAECLRGLGVPVPHQGRLSPARDASEMANSRGR